MIIGYARISTLDQTPALQLDALTAAGAEKLFIDHCSGARKDRPQLAACLAFVREGDTLVFWRTDRLSRSLGHLVELVTTLQGKGVGLRSVQEGLIDTTTATGELLFSIFAVFAQFERSLTRERILAGMAAARARGILGGRKPRLSPAQVDAVRRRRAEGASMATLRQEFPGVSRDTLYRALRATQEEET